MAPLVSEKSRCVQLSSTTINVVINQYRTELDSHADTCTIGRNALVTHTYDRFVNVTAYDPALGSVKDLNVVNAAVAYDSPLTGEVIILNINQAI